MASKTIDIVVVGDTSFRRMADGSLVPLKSRTDWDRADALAGETSSQLVDDAPLTDLEWAKVELRDPFKKPVTIRLDEDIVEWFKAQGPRYQTRINSALRLYVEAHKKVG